jgi:CRP-like cAMP-binding protein
MARMNGSVFRQQNEPFYRNLKPQLVNQWGNRFLRFINQDPCFSDRLLSHVQTFEAGYTILDYKIAKGAEAQPVGTSRQANAYLVLHGRVRILGQSQQRHLPYSVSLLHPGELFGADHVFCEAPLSYQAVAATTCQVVQVPYSYLSFWIDQQPSLGSYWSRCLEQRIQQLFFKRFTPLQTVPSQVLASRLLTRLRERQVDAGMVLGEVMQPYTGYFWVRSGSLTNPSAPNRTLSIGYGWSSEDRYLADGVAQTPLRLLHLQSSAWETPDLLPIMDRLRAIR